MVIVFVIGVIVGFGACFYLVRNGYIKTHK